MYIAENCNRLSRAHERYIETDDRQTTDGRTIAYSDRELNTNKQCVVSPPQRFCISRITGRVQPFKYLRLELKGATILKAGDKFAIASKTIFLPHL